MNKSILWLIGLLFATSFSIVSCSESDGAEDPYANWEERNQKYIDSIATVAKANPNEWKVLRSYKLPALGLDEVGDVNDYVYCKVISRGDGATPQYTDTVGVNYRGKLINGTVFDQSYKGELDPEIAVPTKFPIQTTSSSGLIVGWQTALINMQVGDRWELYIPSDLGYGASGNTSIPGYSTLIFDVNLVKVYPLKGIERSAADALDAE